MMIITRVFCSLSGEAAFYISGYANGQNAMCYRKRQSNEVNVQSAIAREVTATSLFEEDTQSAPVASICHDET
jgi:hypothetical protein